MLCEKHVLPPDRPHQAKHFHMRFIVGENGKGGYEEEGGKGEREVRGVFLCLDSDLAVRK